eukprot:CAMPEP_0198286386 /NCGR_PEP_ID=MMETSP1449-20131203/5478_1 /TAXON_ID=420275 /ORGANISM="Attheya septentrionalis, Strain CCMP2084" /LENGTH=478 /DNA_ID=CAMNT_0043984105 /DNA_START=315 /DNA_END=1748 /DNA_ORIENTATION=+
MTSPLSSARERTFAILLSAFCMYIVVTSLYFVPHFDVQQWAPNDLPSSYDHSSQNKTEEEDSSPLDELIHQTKTPSLRTLLSLLKDHAPTETFREKLKDTEAERARCQRYGLLYNRMRKKRRRVFWGSIIADDSWHTIAAHAAEAYGLYHTVALVESNTTLQLTPRDLRFPPDSLNRNVLQSGIFGPNSKVSVDLYVDDPGGLVDQTLSGLLREQLQRELILQRWKQNGMKQNDIGIVSDVDEMFSRDFLLAAMTCDIPKFRPGQDCRSPKMVAKALVFESSPECVADEKNWMHPDMILGECLDTIGDSTLHKPGEREYKNGTLGDRKEGYGKHENDYAMMPNTTMFPLWKPVDFRSARGGNMFVDRWVGRVNGYTGYHLHNFFESIPVLRKKYQTYGHANPDALEMPLGEIHEDLHLTINCVTQRTNLKEHYKHKAGGFEGIAGSKPLLFEHSDYRSLRNHELREMVLEDEAKFGRF